MTREVCKKIRLLREVVPMWMLSKRARVMPRWLRDGVKQIPAELDSQCWKLSSVLEDNKVLCTERAGKARVQQYQLAYEALKISCCFF